MIQHKFSLNCFTFAFIVTILLLFQVNNTYAKYEYNTDLAIYLTTDKMKFAEEQVIKYNITLKNKSAINADSVIVRGDIPKHTKVANTNNGIEKSGFIEWRIQTLKANEQSTFSYEVKIDKLTKGEELVSCTATIDSIHDLPKTYDDFSTIKVLLYSNNFSDLNHKAYINGYPNGTFRPHNKVTRAEAATIFANIIDIKPPLNALSMFRDVTSSHWAVNNIAVASSVGLFTGYPDGTFKPNDYLTRAQLTIIVIKYLDIGNPVTFSFHFKDHHTHWAKDFIEEAYRYKIISGYNDGTFKPNSPVTRAEFVTVVNNMLYRGPLNIPNSRFPDLDKSRWYFGHVLESSESHNFVRDSDGKERAQY